MGHQKRNTPLFLYKKYNSNEYPKYDNYDAIEVNRIVDFPIGYNGVAGVPITALKYLGSDGYMHLEENGKDTQFEIVGCNNNTGEELSCKKWQTAINGKQVYCRIFIRKK